MQKGRDVHFTCVLWGEIDVRALILARCVFMRSAVTFHSPLFQSYEWSVQPLSGKKTEMIWKRFWDDPVTSFTTAFRQIEFKMDFGLECIWRWLMIHDGVDRAHMRLVSRHAIRRCFENIFKALCNSFHVSSVRKRHVLCVCIYTVHLYSYISISLYIYMSTDLNPYIHIYGPLVTSPKTPYI